jgi:hypothetical protein
MPQGSGQRRLRAGAPPANYPFPRPSRAPRGAHFVRCASAAANCSGVIVDAHSKRSLMPGPSSGLWRCSHSPWHSHTSLPWGVRIGRGRGGCVHTAMAAPPLGAACRCARSRPVLCVATGARPSIHLPHTPLPPTHPPPHLRHPEYTHPGLEPVQLRRARDRPDLDLLRLPQRRGDALERRPRQRAVHSGARLGRRQRECVPPDEPAHAARRQRRRRGRVGREQRGARGAQQRRAGREPADGVERRRERRGAGEGDAPVRRADAPQAAVGRRHAHAAAGVAAEP